MKPTSNRVLAVIPARYDSSRFPGKMLALLSKKPVIQHTYEIALHAKSMGAIDEVLVATDDKRIFDCIKNFGGNAVMTSRDHQTGSDRIAEVVQNRTEDFIVNIQGDEPLLNADTIHKCVSLLRNKNSESHFDITTASTAFISREAILDPNQVKVVTDLSQKALFFSRHPIPYTRREIPINPPFICQKHVGLYAYRREVLLHLTSLKPTELELAESLEQLRALEYGYSIGVADTEFDSIGVDTPSDLERAEIEFSRKKS